MTRSCTFPTDARQAPSQDRQNRSDVDCLVCASHNEPWSMRRHGSPPGVERGIRGAEVRDQHLLRIPGPKKRTGPLSIILAARSARLYGNDDADFTSRGRIVATAKQKPNGQQSLPLKPERTKKLDVSALENWLWEAACTIRGPLDAPKFKDYILPLIFLKRLSDVFEDEVAHLTHDFGDVKTAAKLVEQDHKLVRFYIPQKARWSSIVEKSTGLGELLTDAVRAIARENPRLSGVIDVTEFNVTTAGQRIVDDGRLAALVQVLNDPDYRLGLDDVEPDMIGRAYEYLLRKFAENQGQSAGEFYTPREVAVLMAIILDPQPGMTVDDPCCGSAGLLIKCHLRLLETKGKKTNGRLSLPSSVSPLQLFGQEINSATFAISG